MSYSDSDLRQEIQASINAYIETGDTIVSDWVAMRVIKDHMPEFNKKSDFVTNSVWGHVRKMVGAEVRRFQWEQDDDEKSHNISLPGFELLQSYYECHRVQGNTVQAVRVPRMQMTTAERRVEANTLIKVGQSNIEHGNQLNRETDELIAAGLLQPDEDDREE